jgi:hypothetical protein
MSYYSSFVKKRNKFISIGDTLEIAAQCAITKGDIPAFERALAQLKPFYFDLEYVLFDLLFSYLKIYIN